MKERSRERMAELLLEELFAQLAERESVKQMLGDLTPLPLDEVLRKLTVDFEEAIARRRVEALEFVRKKETTAKSAARSSPQPPPSRSEPSIAGHAMDPAPVTPPSPTGEKKEPHVLQPAPPPPPVPSGSTGETERPPARTGHQPPGDNAYWGEIERILRGGEESVGKPLTEQPVPGQNTVESEKADEESVPPETEPEEDDGDELEGDEAVTIAPGAREQRTPARFDDEDVVYVHAVAAIPADETPSAEPYMLEEKGIDARGFALAFDYEGMRFYLSKILTDVMSISKTGVLLLGKQESLHARGTHEAILNDLRMHGTLLPFEFGTIARGRDDLQGKIDAHLEDLQAALSATVGTKWWTVSLNVLDAKIAQLVASDEPATARRSRTVERTSYTKMPSTKKFDIKLLERILNKEKRIAESVHDELKAVSHRADIDMIVGLGSGSSEDWKTILKASYEVKPEGVKKFYRAVTDLQYRHMMFDLMLSVSGDHEAFSLNM